MLQGQYISKTLAPELDRRSELATGQNDAAEAGDMI
jgi:hypothetical protein